MQDQRVAALEDQMAKTLLQCEQEKEKILTALKTERAIRRKAEADLKAANNVPPKVIKVLMHGPSPAEEVQPQRSLQTPSAQQQCVIKQIVELALENTALKKQIGENALREEAEKKKILEALRKERAMRKQEQAVLKIINKKLEDENTSLKQDVIAKQEAIEFTKSECRSQTRQADEASDARWKSFNEINTTLKNTLNKVVQELIDHITETTSEKAVLEAKLKNTESEVVQGEAEYRIKFAAMEEKMTAQLSEKTTSIWVLEAMLKNTESEVVQGEAEYRIKLDAMEEKMTAQLAEKTTNIRVLEAILKNTESDVVQGEAEYRIKRAAMEEDMTRWHEKWDEKVKDMEKHIKHLNHEHIELLVINRDLEELAQRTDKEKAKLRKDAEKAAKEAAERVRKEEKENKKKAEELLKTQKKESRAKLARDANEPGRRWKWWNKE